MITDEMIRAAFNTYTQQVREQIEFQRKIASLLPSRTIESVIQVHFAHGSHG